jgi:hypothetical protein
LDVNNQGNGTTPFSRVYSSNTTATVTAPASGFIKWTLDNVDYTTSAAANVLMNTAHLMVAYYAPTNGGVVQLTSNSYQTCETCGSVNVIVTRMGSTNSAATVNYATSDITAHAGIDYSGVTNSLSWTPNDNTTRTVNIPILNPMTFGNPKAFLFSLSGATGSSLGLSAALVSIAQNISTNQSFILQVTPNVTITGVVTVQGK